MSSIQEGRLENTSAEQFFASHVSTRVPFKFTSLLKDETFKVSAKLWTDEYLMAHGDDEIQVERRTDSRDSFGKGNECTMTFKEFIKRKDENLYMTTQELRYDTEDRPDILSPPLHHLSKDFPLRPSIMGNLIPQNINLWMGYSSTPASSGLHHDYHDNLYILLRGSKTFTLFHYNLHDCMYTHGELLKIHSNGRINYVGQPTNADGSDCQCAAALATSIALEKAVLQLEEEGGEEAEEDVEKALEAALEAEMMLDYEERYQSDDDDDDDDDDDGDEDDDDDDDDNNNNNDRGLLGPALLGAIEGEIVNQKRALTASAGEKSKKHKRFPSSSTTSETPLNFSKVDTSLADDMLASEFPKYIEARKQRMDVTLKAGEMLYIPAGWFHEVKSGADPGEAHMALNYWFHPPDRVDDFSRPYVNNFWVDDWQIRCK